jgi:hypothetical protein
MNGSATAPSIPRLKPPPHGQVVRGWCLYDNDRWHGPTPQEWDDLGWWVYPDPESTFLGLARELRRRCDLFDAGHLFGPNLVCAWYPEQVTYLSDGYVRDDSGAIFAPGNPPHL